MRNAMLREIVGVWELRGEMEADKARRETFRECADTIRMLVENDGANEAKLDEFIKHQTQCRELLSSARAIAYRKGAGTAWERFDASIAALGISGITPRTYRVLPSDEADAPAKPESSGSDSAEHSNAMTQRGAP